MGSQPGLSARKLLCRMTGHGVITPSDMSRRLFADRRTCVVSATEIYTCLRDLQVIATVPHISEEQITELVKKKLITRADKAGGILLTRLGVHTKTGHQV
jgi:hypothetical protein